MGLIPNNVFSGIADRLAAQAGLVKHYITSGFRNGTFVYPRIHTGIPADGDFTVENDLISAANGIDNNTVSGSMFKSVYNTFIQDLESHVVNQNGVSIDSWLNVSGINVHSDFEDIYYQVKNSHLDGRNVFFPDANILVATFTSTGSGTGTYASNTPVGTGSGDVSTTNYAQAKLLLIPIQNTGADIQVNLRLTKENLAGGTNTDSCNILIPSGTTSGTQFPVNNVISGGHEYLNVSNILVGGGDGDDVFRVYAVRERDIIL